jgi:hypothetical protein
MHALSASYIAPVSKDNPGDLAYFRAHTDEILSVLSQPTNVAVFRTGIHSGRAVSEQTCDVNTLLSSGSGFAAVAEGPTPTPVQSLWGNISHGRSFAYEHSFSTDSATGPERTPFAIGPLTGFRSLRPLRATRALLFKASVDSDSVRDAELELRPFSCLTVRGFAVGDATATRPVVGAEARYDGDRASVSAKYSSDGDLCGLVATRRFYSVDKSPSLPPSPAANGGFVTAVTVDAGIEYLISPASGDDSFSLAALLTVPQATADAAAARTVAALTGRRIAARDAAAVADAVAPVATGGFYAADVSPGLAPAVAAPPPLPFGASLVVNGVGTVSLGLSGPLAQPAACRGRPLIGLLDGRLDGGRLDSAAPWSPHALVAGAAVLHQSILTAESQLNVGLSATGTTSDAATAVAATAGWLLPAHGAGAGAGVNAGAACAPWWQLWVHTLRATVTPDRAAALQWRAAAPSGLWALQATLARTWQCNPRVTHAYPQMAAPAESVAGKQLAFAVPLPDPTTGRPTPSPLWTDAAATTLQVAVSFGHS